MDTTLEDRLIQVLKTFDARQAGLSTQLMQLGVTLEFLTEKVFENLKDEERAALEKEFDQFRDLRYREIQAEWQRLKAQAVNLED